MSGDEWLTLGTPVECTKILSRLQSPDDKKFWKATDIKPRQGIYIGTRTLSNGYRSWEPEIGYVYEPAEYFRAALVVFATNQNPMFVPFDALTVKA